MAKTGPLDFFKQVDEERRKVTWPSRNETFAMTVMVFIMVTLASLFFLAVDQTLSFIVRTLIGLGS